MAFIVDRTFTRTDAGTAWPWESMAASDTSTLESSRTTHSVSQAITAADDGLSITYRESCASYDAYLPYFEVAQPIWQSNNLGTASGISFTHTVVENT